MDTEIFNMLPISNDDKAKLYSTIVRGHMTNTLFPNELYYDAHQKELKEGKTSKCTPSSKASDDLKLPNTSSP